MISDKLLYFITYRSGLCEDEFLNIIESTCIGGADIIQLREKK